MKSYFLSNEFLLFEIRIEKGKRRASLNRIPRSYLSQIIGKFCAVVFSPDHLTLVKSGPEERRSFIDGAICQTDPMYASVLLRYKKILNERNCDWSLIHGQLYYIIMKEKGYDVPHDIEILDLDDEELDKRNIVNQVNSLWTQYRFKDQKIQHGTVSKFFTDKNYGFISTEKDASIFFHKDEFEGDTVHIGQLVSFYTESSFDKVKNEKSVKAVYVRGD